MSKRVALWMTVLGFLAGWTVLAVETSPASLNVLHDFFSKKQGGAVVVGVTGSYPIIDYTYYDYDPETFVVDMADVDVSQLPKVLQVNADGVESAKVEAISRGRGRALAKLEIHKAYLAKCIVSTEGNQLLVRVVNDAQAPEPSQVPAQTSASSPAPAVSPAPKAIQQSPAAAGTGPEPAKPSAPAAQASKPETSLPDASKLLGVSVSEDGGSVDIQTDGATRYKYFSMKDPARIVVDMLGVTHGSVPRQISGAGVIERVRVGLLTAQPPVTRVVLDLKRFVDPWDISGEGQQVVVVRLGQNQPKDKEMASKEAPPQLGSPATSSPSVQPPAPASREAVPQASAGGSAPGAIHSSPSSSAKKSLAAPVNTVPKDAVERVSPESLDKVKVDLSPISPNASKEYKGYQDLFLAQDTTEKAAEGKTLVAGGVPLSFQEKTISSGGVKYTGEPISLSLKDADIKDVLRVFHDLSKMNIVVSPAVQGKVTVDLTNVPWDQAMDIILKNDGLDYIYENNVIWVAPASEIARKFAEQQRIQKEKLLAEDPVTFTKRLSYAKAANMEAIVSKFLSERGSIIVDPRTNTMIIREVPSRKDSLIKLIDSLDTATPQVLIEARIVETSINWSQSFGITWSGNWYTSRNGNGQYVTTNQGSTPTGSNTATPVHLGNSQYTGTGDFAVTLPPSSSNGFIDMVLGNTSGSFFLDVRLAAMENAGQGRILSTPRIMTQDNEKATIESGRQIPIEIATTTAMSVVFVNATLKLDVTPQISADGNVNMAVDITNDSVDFANQTPGQPPPILKKEAKTTLKVQDGHTAVIGGIFVTNEGISQSGLPFLSRIPVLGWLFKNRTKTRTNDELLIFLTPKIVR
ncbi:MAG: type IV pilus secretin PilQ [Acidobacteriota bacterium]